MNNKEISAIRNRLKQLDIEKAELERRLAALVKERAPENNQQQTAGRVTNQSGASEKITLFRSLFRGREDVFPKRWENTRTGKSGYAPACGNEWLAGVCGKPRVKCGECPNQNFLSITDEVIDGHLRGRQTIGVYPMLSDATCWFLAVDFDKKSWQRDAQGFTATCRSRRIPSALERSRSGHGGHVWLFFAEPVPVALARRLGAYLLTIAMKSNPDLGFESYDRLFPSQDTMPAGGFGNLIALPLQHEPRQHGNSIFLDENLEPYPDQWAFLSSLDRLNLKQTRTIVENATQRNQLMELHLPPAEDDEEPWKALPSGSKPSTEITASLDALLQHDTGVLAATTAFGKTVVAAFIIAARKTNTLVLVHRRQLMEQWIARLSTFLDLPASSIGQIGGGKRKPSGGVDVAVLQSLVRKGEVDDIVADYGQIVVDECHHVSAVSFEAAVRAVKAKYVLGLSATVTRQDGQHPIIFMQCGPVRYRTHAKAQARQRSFAHRVLIRTTDFRISPDPGQERLPFPGRGYWSNTSAACTGRTRKRGKRWSMTTWTALFPYLSAWATNVFGVTGISVILWRMLPELPASDTAVPLLADN